MTLRTATLRDAPVSLWLRIVIPLALAALVGLAAISGSFRAVEQQIELLAFAIFERPASGNVHIVEMDAGSMAAIRQWPWSREHYARVVDQLDAAGARSISFDVDFSSASQPAQDAAFAAAIAAANAPVVLPTLAQQHGSGDARKLDSLPIASLREHAHLASVSIAPDPDGFIRRMPFGTVTDAHSRPSIAAYVAGHAGEIGTSFPIDYAINPASIPRHSFIAVERGEFDPARIKGKDVIIGATAVEMGDRYPVPRHGVIHGVIVQALAAETLLAGAPVYGGWLAPLTLAALLAVAIGAAQKRTSAALRCVIVCGAIVTGWLAARSLLGVWFEIVPAIMLAALVAGLQITLLTHRLAERGRRIDGESGLPNRLALHETAARDSRRFVIAAQIDDFDALKLAVGQDRFGEMLRRLAERLRSANGDARVHRLDARTLAWATPLGLEEIEALLAGLRAVMRSPFEVAGNRLGVALTFGVAAADSVDAAANAAHAASLAKRSGKPWRLHTAGADTAASTQFSLLGELDEALSAGHVTTVYQPKLNLATDRIDAVEALVRWNHPQRGMLPPDSFIPLIEETDRIEDLTIAILSRALDDMRKWSEQGLIIAVAINVSARLVASQSFFERAQAVLARSGVPADLLTFEVTESAQFDDTDQAIAMLGKFRDSGIGISMDDYGTGLSSLNYLKLLPVSELKIDRMFVQHAHHDHGDAMMVRSTVQLAHELGIKVVAEGIEEAECLAFLRSIRCDYAQGYHISRPLGPDALAERVAAEQSLAA